MIKGRLALVKMADENNEMEYEEQENFSPGSQQNSSGNSNKYYPDLSNSLSDLENSLNSDRTTNKFINLEQRRLRSSVKGRSRITDESNNFIGQERHNIQPTQEDKTNAFVDEEYWNKQTPSNDEKLRGIQTSPNDAARHRGRRTSLPVRNASPKSQPTTHEALKPKIATLQSSNWFLFFVLIGVIVIGCLLIGLGAVYSGLLTLRIFTRSEHQTSNQIVYCNDFSKLRSEFPHQSDKLWAFLKSGVERVANKKPTKPSIFMLVHETDVDITQLLNKIVWATQNCLGTKSNTPTYLTPSTLNAAGYINDYGRVISDYKSALSASGVMIVENFNKVTPYVAQAFHTICDGETPYVARSVIILTLPVEQISTDDNPFKIAENHLTTLWASSLKSNILGPLLYRVTDVTLHINREL